MVESTAKDDMHDGLKEAPLAVAARTEDSLSRCGRSTFRGRDIIPLTTLIKAYVSPTVCSN